MMANAIAAGFTEDDDDIFCEDCSEDDDDVDEEHDPSKAFNDDPFRNITVTTFGNFAGTLNEESSDEPEEIDVDLSSASEPETVDVPEEEIESVPEEPAEEPATEAPEECFHQGQNVKFKGDEARTWNGNKIAGGVYKFIKYDEKTPTKCLITKGPAKKQFKVIAGALEPA